MAAARGEAIGIYAARILDTPLPWTRMRAVYALIGLARTYGNDPVEQACSAALELDVISVGKIKSIVEKGTGKQAAQAAARSRQAGDAAAAARRSPGGASPARAKDRAAPGPRPGYCEQEVPEDRGDGTPVLVRHTAMTAFRRRQQLAGQPGQDRPVTAAVSRAAVIRDDTLAAMSRLGAQLSAALDQLAALGAQLAAVGDLEAGEAQAEAVRAE